MGYDPNRFVGRIDDEFKCPICTFALENPMQSPCEHNFCNECIKDWLRAEASCPVDRCALALNDLKPTPRYFRNILDKIEIRCDFEPEGCKTIVQLEFLKDHLTRCILNPDAEVICDKGCNIKMPRSEYESKNCFTHLSNRQQEEITKLSDEVNRQREQITQLNLKISRVCGQATYTGTVLSHILNATLNWRKCLNVTRAVGQPHILEYYSTNSGNGFSQLLYSLGPGTSCFKVKVLAVDNPIGMGLTRRGHLHSVAPGDNEESIGYRSNGDRYVDKTCRKNGPQWKNGDLIECGIRFPSHFTDDGIESAEFYFSMNGELVLEDNIILPHDGFFPTVFVWTRLSAWFKTVSKVECYLSN